jgi:antitoxin HicB
MKDTAYYLGLRYRKVVSQDDKGTYIVEVPDLPGCVSDGDTLEEAFAELNDAMAAWISARLAAGLPVPEPHSSSEYSGKFLVRVPRSLHQRLAEQAEADGVSLNQCVVGLLSEGSIERSASKRLELAASSLVEIAQFARRAWYENLSYKDREIFDRLDELARERSEKTKENARNR